MRARENLLLKVLAFVLAVACFSTSAVLGCYQLANLDVIWGESSAAGGYTIRHLQSQDIQSITYMLDLRYMEQENGSLISYEQQVKTDLEEQYSADKTNLRWQCALWQREGGAPGAAPRPVLGGVLCLQHGHGRAQ